MIPRIVPHLETNSWFITYFSLGHLWLSGKTILYETVMFWNSSFTSGMCASVHWVLNKMFVFVAAEHAYATWVCCSHCFFLPICDNSTQIRLYRKRMGIAGEGENCRDKGTGSTKKITGVWNGCLLTHWILDQHSCKLSTLNWKTPLVYYLDALWIKYFKCGERLPIFSIFMLLSLEFSQFLKFELLKRGELGTYCDENVSKCVQRDCLTEICSEGLWWPLIYLAASSELAGFLQTIHIIAFVIYAKLHWLFHYHVFISHRAPQGNRYLPVSFSPKACS